MCGDKTITSIFMFDVDIKPVSFYDQNWFR